MMSFIDLSNVITSHLDALPVGKEAEAFSSGAGVAYLGKYIGTAITMLAAGAVGVMQGFSTANAVQAVARNPEAQPKILSTMIVGLALAEAVAIYALIVSILLIFVA
ncbi:F0F1 ATP synthase subunit C [Ureaplasma zalophigenitalium]|uniref:ATP synthase subunit c n=1 Tax=Ureaplasma zalophigenitalium TaxID=907723 RepID=A0ABT3BPQ4_9BACT|nr:F0F1 ATP synthase subunit C [Ureaplasma zalophigenitalium]